jgi:hypothetical protein
MKAGRFLSNNQALETTGASRQMEENAVHGNLYALTFAVSWLSYEE